MDFNATFAPISGDSVKDLTLSFPPGLLSNENIDGGACLASPPPASGTPNAACQVGTSKVTSTLLGVQTLTLFLVAPPKATDVAGVAAYLGATQIPPTADVTLGPAGLSTAFTNLPNLGISAIDTSLTGLRLPTSCPSPAANVIVTADSQMSSTPASATAPLAVTGCAGLPCAPNLTAAIVADSKGNAELKTTVTQAAGESASKAITIIFPSGLTPNAGVLIPCLNATGCTIGSATATSPLVPGTLSGAVTIGGSALAPTFAIKFPALNTTLGGSVDLSHNSVTFTNVPDFPLTNLSLDVTGANGQRVFLTDCKPASVTGSFTAQGGQTHTSTAPISYSGCSSSTGTGTGNGTGSGSETGSSSSHKPKASGSITGLASGHPRLRLRVTDASPAKITSVAVGLPAGLKFSQSAFVLHKVCTVKGKKRHCKTTRVVKGLRISGGSARSVVLKSGRLVITLKNATGRVTITAAGPLLIESKSLETKAKHHKVGTLRFTLKVTTANHERTTLTLSLH